MKKLKKVMAAAGKIILILTAVMALTVGTINIYMKRKVADRIISEDALNVTDADCILILGCSVYSTGVPSPMLQERLDTGISLYKKGSAFKLLVSGDHGTKEYDEVNAMKQYVMNAGVPSEDVFMDHAGFSTYDSLYRARNIFGAEKIIVVTQSYHLSRALYLAEAFGMDAYGVPCETQRYHKQWYRDLREVAARCKDFFMAIFKPESTITGEPVSLTGSGNVTNDH